MVRTRISAERFEGRSAEAPGESTWGHRLVSVRGVPVERSCCNARAPRPEWVLLVLVGLLVAAVSATASTRLQPVDVGVYVLDISQIRELEQSVVADFAVIASWQQDDLADADAPDRRLFPLGEVDSPRLFVINGRSLETRFDDLVEVDPAGRVIYRQRFQGALSVPMQLKDFPMDVQTFEIEVGTLAYRSRALVADLSRSGVMKGFTVAGWMVEPEAVVAGDQMAPDGVHSYSTVTAVYRAERNGLFFAWKLFIPLGLIVLMAYAVFWLDPTVFGTQIAIATSTVFTLIAYNFSLSNILPPISYLTRADLYLVGCMLLVFGALGEAVVTGVLAREDEHVALARRIDVVARFVYPALFAVVVVVAFA